MAITALPTPPSRAGSPSDFSDKTDALLGALPLFVSEVNATQSDFNAKKTDFDSKYDDAMNSGLSSAASNASAAAASAISAAASAAAAANSAASINPNSMDINGGTIDGTVIGGTTPAAGSFTTLSATGALNTNGLKEDASGNLGLGTTTLSNSAGYATFSLNGTNGGQIAFQTGGVAKQYIYSSATDLNFFNSQTGNLILHTTGSERARIDASGSLLVGQTTSGPINVNGVGLAPVSTGGIDFNHANGTASGILYARFNYSGSTIGSITQSGTTSVAYNATSDHRLKDNVRLADAKRFCDIRFVDFEWADGRHDCGVIAHELQAIYPDLVVGEKDATEIRQVEISPAIPAVTEQQLVSEAVLNDDGEEIEPAVYETVEVEPAVEAVFEDQEFPVYQQVNYIGLIPRMGVMIQKQQRLIESLEARLADFETRLSTMEAA